MALKKNKKFKNHQPAALLSRNCTRHQGRPDQAFPRDSHVDTLRTLSSHQCFPFPGIILFLSADGVLLFSMTVMEMKGLARTSCILDQTPGL